jgi:hypothetical protein
MPRTLNDLTEAEWQMLMILREEADSGVIYVDRAVGISGASAQRTKNGGLGKDLSMRGDSVIFG